MKLLVFGPTFETIVLSFLYLLLPLHHDPKELRTKLFLSVFDQLLFLIDLRRSQQGAANGRATPVKANRVQLLLDVDECEVFWIEFVLELVKMI